MDKIRLDLKKFYPLNVTGEQVIYLQSLLIEQPFRLAQPILNNIEFSIREGEKKEPPKPAE